MISELILEYFKCFESLSLPLRSLTLLSGTNSSGKSSVIQSLVLLHQTMREQEWSQSLLLNGPTVSLGTVADVVDQLHGRRTLRIGLTCDKITYQWTFSGDRPDMSMVVDEIQVGDDSYDGSANLHCLMPSSIELPSGMASIMTANYLTAERMGPRDVYLLDDSEKASVVGSAGEHAVSMLHWNSDKPVVENLCLPEAPLTLLRQVEKWMGLFFPGCGLILERIPRVDAVTLGLRTSESLEFHRPTNVGFGLTQVLPILVAALSSSPGDLILIENPEVHLHPAGQSQMGTFLAQVAASGIQVILESHSDHVLNGIRRAVRSGALNADDVQVHFFNDRYGSDPQVTSPDMGSDGSLDSWPRGFFDQFEKDTMLLAGWEIE